MNAPLFAPWLLTGELKPRKVEPLRAYLGEVLARRRFPLHLNVLWNCVYWGWSLETETYEHMTDTDLIEPRSSRNIDEALPVGAFVALAPSERKLLWGEVVYKEREVPPADPGVCSWELDASFLEGSYSDAPIREHLVLDYYSLLRDQQDLVEREQHRERILNYQGHVVLDARYAPSDTRLDDGAFFVEYLLRHFKPALIGEYSKTELTVDDARGALLTSLQSLRDVLTTTPGLRCWSDYWFRGVDLEGERDLLDGADRLAMVRRTVIRLPQRMHVAYHAVAPALREWADHANVNEVEHLAFGQTAYVARICHTNAFLVGEAKATDGYVVREVARRVDGGVWRSERVTGHAPAYVSLPPQLELPYGRVPRPDLRDRAAHLLAEVCVPSAEFQVEFRAKKHRLRSPVTQADIDTGRLRIGAAAALLQGHAVRFSLRVPREDRLLASADAAVDHERELLVGIDWGGEVYPGLCVYSTVPNQARRIDAYVQVLPQPVRVEGSADPLPWAFDSATYTAALRAARSLPPERSAKLHSAADLLSTAFTYAGARENDRYIASLTDLYCAIVRGASDTPPDIEFGELLLRLLLDSPLVTELPDGRFAYKARITGGVASDDPTTLAAWWDGAEGRRVRAAVYQTERWKRSFHLRRWDHKDPARWEARRQEFKEAAAGAKAFKYMHMADLPSGYTWVSESIYHRRKSIDQAPADAEQ